MLCATCSQIPPLLAAEPDQIHGGKHQQTYLDLRDSAELGCYICGNIWKHLRGTDVTDTSHSSTMGSATSFTGSYTLRKREFMITICLLLPSGFQGLQVGCPEYFNFRLEPCLGALPPDHIPQLSDSTSSPESLNQALRWHQMCLRDHPTCRESKSRYPTRLLDVGTDPSDLVHVINTTNEQISGPYVTLSHRWGQVQPLRLLRSNLDLFMVNIDWKDLPRTFRHAIEFTRFLRVRYIWIDSLCIIQDKDWLNDWFHEAGFMQDVYQGSFLNLAADSASDSTQGLFRIRNARLEQPCYISLTGDTALQDGSKEYKLYESSSWRIQVAKSPLAKRSWYLQERLLAPRILHFGSQQLLWECHQQTAAETFPNGLPKSMDIRASFRFKAFSWSSITPEDVFDRTWPDIFEAYTVSQLTNPGDKLIALSGVSKKLQSRVESPYIAGLWEANLILQLCWRVDVHYEELPQRPLHYRAPSFSWACLDAPVQNPVFQNATYCAEVVQASATPVADDCYGAVKDAFVLLRCPLKLTRLELLNLGHGRPKVEVLLDAGGPKRGDAYLDSPGIDLERKDIYAATLVLYEIDEWDNIFGLLLEPYGLDGIFKRIGLFNYCLLSDPVSKILAPSPDATNFPCEHFDRATGKHTIRLI